MSKDNNKILFLVHCEKMFEYMMDANFHYELSKTIFSEDWDKIYIMEAGMDDSEFPGLNIVEGLAKNSPITEKIYWSWGYEPDQFDEDENKHIIETSYGRHDYTYVPEKLRNIKDKIMSYEISICGGHDDECLEDFREVLKWLGVNDWNEKAVF